MQLTLFNPSMHAGEIWHSSPKYERRAAGSALLASHLYAALFTGNTKGLSFLKSRCLMARDDRTQRQAGGDLYTLVVFIHGDRFPGAVLHAKRAADATVQIHFDDFEQIRMIRSRHYF